MKSSTMKFKDLKQKATPEQIDSARERIEALQLARDKVNDHHSRCGVHANPARACDCYASTRREHKLARALLVLAADLEAVELKNEKLSALIIEQEKQYRGERKRVEQEVERLKEYEGQWNELSSPEFLNYWHTIGFSCSAGTAIKHLLKQYKEASKS